MEQKRRRGFGRTALAMMGVILATGAIVAVLTERRSAPKSAPAETGLAHGVDAITSSGELVVLTVRSPTTFRMRGEQITGYEVDLTMAFADELGVEVSYRLFDDIPSLMTAIEAGEGHIAAPGLTQREVREHTDGDPQLIFGPAYKTVSHELVCRRDGNRPRNWDEVSEVSIAVISGSGNEEALERRQAENPELVWRDLPLSSGLQMAERVHDKRFDCAVLDSHSVAIARRLYPELSSVLDLSNDDRQLAWQIAPQSADLMPELTSWFETAHQAGFLSDLDEYYYGHLEEFDYFDLAVFRQRIETRLPDYEAAFREAAEARNLDWTLLASQAYQESHWDPVAKSPTGVRGLMMLTLPTAREVGVSNRLDAFESIDGGATYLDRLYARLPESIVGYDRLWMAIAAYNVGYGHLMDARRLAERQGRDKDKWRVIKTMLPLLTQRKYYSTVRYGYARGYEPVKYVRRIREYDDVLTSEVPRPEQPPFTPQGLERETAEADAGATSPTAGAGVE